MYERSFASRNTHAPRGSGGGEGHIAAVEEMLCPGSLYANGNRVVAQPGPVIPEFVYARPATGFEYTGHF